MYDVVLSNSTSTLVRITNLFFQNKRNLRNMENELYFEVYFLLKQITITMPGVFFIDIMIKIMTYR